MMSSLLGVDTRVLKRHWQAPAWVVGPFSSPWMPVLLAGCHVTRLSEVRLKGTWFEKSTPWVEKWERLPMLLESTFEC